MKYNEASFRRFHEDNPHVYSKLVGYTQTLRDAGIQRVGIRMIWERMRWDHLLATHPHDQFKLNDHYTSFYVRKIGSEHPHLSRMFETRERQAA